VITLPQLNLDPRTVASIAGATLAVVLLLLVWRWYRRHRVRAGLLATVTGGAYEYLCDILVPDGQGGSLHIDFLLLTTRGCVVLDMRNIAGNIFGGDQMTAWTVMHRALRYTFANPQTGLYDRIAAVRAVVEEMPVEGRVVFSPRGRFPKGLPRFTLMLGSLPSEYPAAERMRSGALSDSWRTDWERLRAACTPSSLVAPKAAI
jgi:Nuclease-related domain